MKIRSAILALAACSASVLAAGCNADDQHPADLTAADSNLLAWRKIWATTAAFKSPESAAISHNHRSIFISNVNGYERNGAGFISRLSLDGEVEDLVWLDGLNAPAGIAVAGDTLWVVDLDRLAEIDIPGGRIRAFYPSPDKDALLNDVAVSDAGEVFVTGSASNSVYVLAGSELTLWYKDDENLAYANGIHATPDEIIVAAYHLVRINRADKEVAVIGDRETLFDLEGVKPDGAGGFYVSAIGDRPLYHVKITGETAPLIKGQDFLADFDLSRGLFVAPTSADTILALKAPNEDG